MSMVSDDGDYSVAGFAAAAARKAVAALIAENHRLRKHLREIGLSASVCAQLSGDEEERVPWEMISNRADHALSTPSEAPESITDNIGGDRIGMCAPTEGRELEAAVQQQSAAYFTGDAVREALEKQMDAMTEDFVDLPSSIHREAGRVWLEGWFDIPAALNHGGSQS